ncbi:hypothetical protein NDU88_005877 [Pleurodeles waltl]|uniref:Uncharacterized protein n=1 Tax=Pleurodeles waltl TaxID=8319 RepID=A0AAV7W913_PLEWA|nr:hypothetical protein NDU88_005877 [Pleurodeles waltl]
MPDFTKEKDPERAAAAEVCAIRVATGDQRRDPESAGSPGAALRHVERGTSGCWRRRVGGAGAWRCPPGALRYRGKAQPSPPDEQRCSKGWGHPSLEDRGGNPDIVWPLPETGPEEIVRSIGLLSAASRREEKTTHGVGAWSHCPEQVVADPWGLPC